MAVLDVIASKLWGAPLLTPFATCRECHVNLWSSYRQERGVCAGHDQCGRCGKQGVVDGYTVCQGCRR